MAAPGVLIVVLDKVEAAHMREAVVGAELGAVAPHAAVEAHEGPALARPHHDAADGAHVRQHLEQRRDRRAGRVVRRQVQERHPEQAAGEEHGAHGHLVVVGAAEEGEQCGRGVPAAVMQLARQAEERARGDVEARVGGRERCDEQEHGEGAAETRDSGFAGRKHEAGVRSALRA